MKINKKFRIWRKLDDRRNNDRREIALIGSIINNNKIDLNADVRTALSRRCTDIKIDEKLCETAKWMLIYEY